MDADVCDLLSAWLGREIEPERREELLARLRRDEEFRHRFAEEIRMLGMLKVVQSPEPRWLRLEDELGWGASEPAQAASLEDRILRDLHAPQGPTATWRRHWAAAAVAVLAAAAVLAMFWPPGTATRPGAVPRPHRRVEPPTGLAMVIKLDGVRWESTDEPHPSEGDVLEGGRLQFASGRVMLSMLTGVILDVEGPADLDLIDFDRVRCRRGRIRSRVPAGAEGFLVLGPSSAVVDLGTEFGLNVAPDGKMRGQVFKGRVEAALLSPAGTPQRSFYLDAGRADATKAFEIDSRAGHIEAIRASEDFLRPSVPTSAPLPLGAEYAAAVLGARPWGYWRLESMDGDKIHNEVPSRAPLRATGPIRLVGTPASGGNHWAEFESSQGAQFLELPEPWYPTWRPGFAVEFWCLSNVIGHASLVSLVSPKDTDHHVFLMELTSRNRLTIHKPASVRLLHRWPPGWESGDNTYSQEHYVPYRWHHVVGQVRGDHIELFMDGQLSSSLSITPEHGDVACQLVLGRLTDQPGSGLSIDRPFTGCLDEVALYDHPLASEAIREHHRLGAARRSFPR
jgi:hypothetical protein